jgi:hypothetical protein
MHPLDSMHWIGLNIDELVPKWSLFKQRLLDRDAETAGTM